MHQITSWRAQIGQKYRHVLLAIAIVALSPILMLQHAPDAQADGAAPSVPANFKAEIHESQAHKILLSWDAAGENDPAVTTYHIEWKEGTRNPDPETLQGTPGNGWWNFNGVEVLSSWGSGKYAEIYQRTDGWDPRVWLPHEVVQGPLFDDLVTSQLWAEHVIDNYHNWEVPSRYTTWQSQDKTDLIITWGTKAGTDYTLRLRAKNDDGYSPWSKLAFVSTPRVPDAPGKPPLTVGPNWITAEYVAPTGEQPPIKFFGVVWTQVADETRRLYASAQLFDYQGRPKKPANITRYDLEPYTDYQVQVRAYTFDGYSGPWSEPAFVKTLLAAPTLTAGNRSIVVSWTDPANKGTGATQYSMQWKSGSQSYHGEREVLTSLTAYTITGLTNGVAYTVRLRARNAGGHSAWSGGSGESSATPDTPPAAPDAPTLEAANGQVTVSWSEPANEGTAITGYTVQWKSGSQDYHADREAATVGTSHTITGLTNGVAYTVRVRASNAAGDGGWSEESSATPDTPPAAPNAPTLEVTNGQITVSWSEPANEGTAITGYTVQWKEDSPAEVDPTALERIPSSGWFVYNGVHVLGYASHKPYIEVRQVSEGFKATVWLADGIVQRSPVYATLRDTQVWAEYVKDHYLDWQSGPQGYAASHQQTVTGASHTIAGLNMLRSHSVRVRAGNAAGDGEWSGESSGYPDTVPPKLSQPTLKILAAGKFGVYWTEPEHDGSPITHYTVGWHVNNATLNGSDWFGTATGTSYTVTTAPLQTDYYVEVRACNQAGCATEVHTSPKITMNAPSWAPSKISLEAGIRQIKVTWPSVTDSRDIDPAGGHKVQWKAADAKWEEAKEAKIIVFDSTSYTMEGLTNATTYDVRVKVFNAYGDGPWPSSPLQATTASLPEAPVFSTDTAGKVNQIRVRWEPPADDGYAIESYTVQWKRGTLPNSVSGWYVYNGVHIKGVWNERPYAEVRAKSGGYEALVLTSDGSKLRSPLLDTLNEAKLWAQQEMFWDGAGKATVPADPAPEPDTQYKHVATGLAGDGAKYSIRVRAASAVGYGPWAKGSANTAAPPDAPVLSVIWNKATSKDLLASWKEPYDGGASVTGYQIQWRLGEAEPKVENHPYNWPSGKWWEYNGVRVYGNWGYWPYAEVRNRTSTDQGWNAKVWLAEETRMERNFDGDGHWPAKNWAEYTMWWGASDVLEKELHRGGDFKYLNLPIGKYNQYISVRIRARNDAGWSPWSGNHGCIEFVGACGPID